MRTGGTVPEDSVRQLFRLAIWMAGATIAVNAACDYRESYSVLLWAPDDALWLALAGRVVVPLAGLVVTTGAVMRVAHAREVRPRAAMGVVLAACFLVHSLRLAMGLGLLLYFLPMFIVAPG